MSNSAMPAYAATSIILRYGVIVVLLSFSGLMFSLKGGFIHSDLLQPNLKSSTQEEELTDDLTELIGMTLSRKDYSPLDYFTSNRSNLMIYDVLKPHLAVLEPYAEMSIFVEDFDPAKIYSVEVCDDADSCVSGSLYAKKGSIVEDTFSLDCNSGSTYSIKFSVYKDQTNSLNFHKEYSGTALCMYVRREIRSLSTDDLDATMDAMYALWSTKENEGIENYGDNFHAIDYFLELHHFNAAQQEADHFHEGNGFLLQHVKMTNAFELAMQAVDPSVALPYWDFTIETSEGATVYESIIMSSDMFGTIQAPSEYAKANGYTYSNDTIKDFAIPDGRWKHIKAGFNPDRFTDFVGKGYGYLRSPWNMNPSPYIVRFTGNTPLPSCDNHYDILKTNDMMSFMYYMEDSPHAATHGSTGGVYGCDLFKPLLDAGYINDHKALLYICKNWNFSLKKLYRHNYIHNTSSCEVPDDVQDAFCPFSCNYDGLALNLLKNIIADQVPSDMSDQGVDAWLSFLCGGDGSRVFSGDHLESASPSDPSFWPIHPTLDRLLHAKFLAGGFSTTAWSTDATDACMRASCYIESEGGYDKWDDCCYGHYEDSRMLDATVGDRHAYTGPTNGEVATWSDAADATKYNMSYVYDGFTWDHCEEEGSDFNALFPYLYDKMHRL